MSNVHQLKFFDPVVQKDLFAHNGIKTHRFSCLDIAKYNQCRLTDIITDFGVTNIFDTRTFPVFRKPKFHYPQLFNFFNRNSVQYSTIPSDKDSNTLNKEINTFFNHSSYHGRLVSLIVIHDNLSQNNSTNLNRVKNFINSNNSVQELYLSS